MNRWKRCTREQGSVVCCYAIGIALGGEAGLPYLQRVITNTIPNSNTYRTSAYYRMGTYYQLQAEQIAFAMNPRNGGDDDSKARYHATCQRAIPLLTIAAEKNHVWSCLALARLYQHQLDIAIARSGTTTVTTPSSSAANGRSGHVDDRQYEITQRWLERGMEASESAPSLRVRAQATRLYAHFYDTYIIPHLMDGNQRREAVKQTFKHYYQAACDGDAEAMNSIAEFYDINKYNQFSECDELTGYF
jgi:TPR repeat protein